MHVQLEYNYKQLDDGNQDLLGAMNLLIDKSGNCLMKAAMDKAGIKIDLSEKDQLLLIDSADLTDCSCRKSDAWKCAVDKNLPNAIACGCSCHRR